MAQIENQMRAPDIVLIPQNTYKRMRWKNGGGWTTEIAIEDGDENGFAWRVSIADVETDGDFSIFPGVDRSLVVLSGGGMALDDRSGPPHELRPLDKPHVFPGEVSIYARLMDGPTRDFNVMTRRTLYTHSVDVIRPGTPVRLVRNAVQSVFVHVFSGEASDALADDSFMLPMGPDATIDLSAETTLLVVHLRSVGRIEVPSI